jgi:hypothetical protein
MKITDERESIRYMGIYTRLFDVVVFSLLLSFSQSSNVFLM